MMRWWLVPIALVSYLVGTAAHELTHAAAARATGSEITDWSVWPTYVEYRPRTPICDPIIRGSTLGVAPLLLVLYAAILWLVPSATILACGGAVVGYLPRSQTDWAGVYDIYKGNFR